MSKTTPLSGNHESVVFFGSGPVAAKSLELLSKNFVIEAIITKPTTFEQMTSVAKKAPVYSVSTRAELDELIASRSFQSNLGVLIDFGIIVSQAVIDYFPLGIINSHFSILPQWRGADPISFAILSGQEKTGVSLMLLTAGMDEGPLLGYGELTLKGDETTPTLTESLIHLSDGLLTDEVPLHLKDPTKGAPQESTGYPESYSRKLTKEDGIIDWSKPAVDIQREIRAFIEWPKSRSVLADKDVIITSSHIVNVSGVAGTIVVDGKQLLVHCGSKTLAIDTLKPAGKKEMTAAAFLAGYRHLLEQ